MHIAKNSPVFKPQLHHYKHFLWFWKNNINFLFTKPFVNFLYSLYSCIVKCFKCFLCLQYKKKITFIVFSYWTYKDRHHKNNFTHSLFFCQAHVYVIFLPHGSRFLVRLGNTKLKKMLLGYCWIHEQKYLFDNHQFQFDKKLKCQIQRTMSRIGTA